MFAAGLGLAIAQPGDLGDDDEGAATPSTLDEDTTTSAGDGTTGSTTTTGSTSTTGSTTTTEGTASTTGETTTTVTDTTTTTTPPTTSTTVETSVSGSEVDPELANSGGESLAIPALAVVGLGLGLRRLRGTARPS